MITAALAWLAGSRTALIAVVAALALSMAALGTQTLRLAWEKTDHADDKTRWAEQVAKAEHQGRLDTEAAKTEGERRYAEQSKKTEEANQRALQAESDRALADTHGLQLQDTATQLAKQLRAATANTATAELRASASTTAGVLADVLAGMEQAGRTMATTATKRGIAGDLCSASYDSLTVAKRSTTAVDFKFPITLQLAQEKSHGEEK